MEDTDKKTESDREKIKRQLVCICKGVNLGAILKALPDSETVSDVNKKANVGNGGCQGERCGPKIKALLKKYRSKNS